MSARPSRIHRLPPLLLQRTLWLALRFLRIFQRKKTVFEGTSNLEKTARGAIFAVNHISHIDPVLVPMGFSFFSTHFPLYYVSRPKGGYDHLGFLGRWFYGGELFKLWGAYPAPKGIGDLGEALKYHTEILKQDGSLLVFPEAGIPHHEDPGLARPGIGFLAETSAAPIIPVYISRNNGRMIVRYGAPFNASDLSHEKIGDEKSRCKHLSQEILKRVYSLKS